MKTSCTRGVLFCLVLVLGSLFAPGGGSARAGILLKEPFDWPDGGLVAGAGGRWVSHSGTAGQVDVVGGELHLAQSETEDVSAPLLGQPYPAASGKTLYARFKLRVLSAPTGAGSYFAHFKDGANGFRGRVFVTTNGAPGGSVVLGVAAGGATASAVHSKPVTLNATATVVVGYSVGDAKTALWVDPSQESDAVVRSTDTAGTVPISTFSFRQALSSGAGMGVLRVDDLVVAGSFEEALSGAQQAAAPRFEVEPQDAAAFVGDTVRLRSVVSGDAPMEFLWLREGVVLPGAAQPELSLASVAVSDAAGYQVVAGNAIGWITSRVARVWVEVAAGGGGGSETIAGLRRRLDPVTLEPTNTTVLHTVEGVVTTHVNLSTPANAQFFVQDETGGIAVFVAGGATLRPAAGDRLRVTGPLGHSNGQLQLNLRSSSVAHHVELVSTNNPLPDPVVWSALRLAEPGVAESLEGCLVVVSNVVVDPEPSRFSAGTLVEMIDEEARTLVLRVDSRVTELVGQPKPVVPVTVLGVLGQQDGSAPRDSGYYILPTRAVDLQENGPAPRFVFTNLLSLAHAGEATTNTFSEVSLWPGDRLRLEVVATDPAGRLVEVTVLPGPLPHGGRWSIPDIPSVAAVSVFEVSIEEADAGSSFEIGLRAGNGRTAARMSVRVYVPTEAERGLVITEFLANPPGTTNAPHYNALRRPTPSPLPSTEDEYVELVNLGGGGLDLAGWSLGDGAAVRHRFAAGTVLARDAAMLVIGGAGASDGDKPGGGVMFVSASEAGLGLNNTGGDLIWVRNSRGDLVTRVAYGALSTQSSMTRPIDPSRPFQAHELVSTLRSSAGLRADGAAFGSAEPVGPSRPELVLAFDPGGAPVLGWTTEPQVEYTVLVSDHATGPFVPLAAGLRFDRSRVRFTDALASGARSRFYQVKAAGR